MYFGMNKKEQDRIWKKGCTDLNILGHIRSLLELIRSINYSVFPYNQSPLIQVFPQNVLKVRTKLKYRPVCVCLYMCVFYDWNK